MKADFKDTHLYNIGILDHQVARMASLFSDRLFQLFLDRVKRCVNSRRNLIISGGCGLNCDWNTRWRNSGVFNDVFIPPVANDSGVAIGAAVDAQLSASSSAKLSWFVYAGEMLCEDITEIPGFTKSPFNADEISRLLTTGAIVAWARGKYEIGPRALGNRSLLASPFSESTRARLNQIKDRESYRPIAPVCTEDHAAQWFTGQLPSPYMLHFSNVLDKRLNAVRHVDGTARVQTVKASQNESLQSLLSFYSEKNGGIAVLCNTSLNRRGRGFFNRLSDIAKFVTDKGLEVIATDSSM